MRVIQIKPHRLIIVVVFACCTIVPILWLVRSYYLHSFLSKIPTTIDNDHLDKRKIIIARDVDARRRYADDINNNDIVLLTQTTTLLSDASLLSKSLTIDEKRLKIREMMQHAWSSYSRYAWSANELKPIAKTAHSSNIFGAGMTVGATIVDAIDTLHIMQLTDEYERAREWIANNYSLAKATGSASVFETTIRFVGGLLSIYALTNDSMYINKAQETADLLLPAFNTPSGIPYALVNLQSHVASNWGWASSGSSILSEVGTLHLEFVYLSQLTNRSIYADKVRRARNVLDLIPKADGLYSNYINPNSGNFVGKHVSVGALGDSFYEYLLKSWLLSGKSDTQAKRMHDDAIAAIERAMMRRSASDGLLYIAELRDTSLEHKMSHLACFVVGLFALHAANEQNDSVSSHYLTIAKDLGHTCHESYVRTATGIGPELFYFTDPKREARALGGGGDVGYILRPEVIEGWFYLWRVTKDDKYRDWAWSAAMAIERYCRTDSGYTGIRNVDSEQPARDDVQQSFFLAETLKYLYLIFTDDSVIPLDKWVFNTEAHPLPVMIVAAS